MHLKNNNLRLLSIALFIFGALFSGFAQIDRKVSFQTQALYNYLKDNKGKGLLFGHQFSTLSGVNFDDNTQCKGMSDVFFSVGDYPAVFGFDFLNGFSNQLPAVKWAFSKGAIITFSFHIQNPVSPDKGYKPDDDKTVSKILPGGTHHQKLLQILDSIASFAQHAEIKNKKIPIIFRPWHEHTGGWFWWGTNSCTPDEFVKLWRFTVEYLRDVKGVHNFIYAYSPSKPAIRDDGYETRNPGPDYFDIAGFDCYSEGTFKDELIQNCKVTAEYATKHNKIAAITEFGYSKGIQNSDNPEWFWSEFLQPIKNDSSARQMVYALTWRNTNHAYWIPLKNHIQYNSFVKIHNDPYLIFLSKSEYTKIANK